MDSPVFTAPAAPPAPRYSLEAERRAVVQAKLMSRAEQLVERYDLPVAVAGFTDHMPRDQEYKLFQGRRPNEGAVLLNSRFWVDGQYYDSDSYLHYALFRAAAEYFFRRYFDADHGAWNVASVAGPMQTVMGIFRESTDISEASWTDDKSEMSPRDAEFRRSMDPSGDPVNILRGLTRYAFSAIEQRAADEWAVAHYHKVFKEPETGLIQKHVRDRERALAWDFNRATSAMTLGERVAFRHMLKSPFQYTNQPAREAPPPVALGAGADPGTEDPLPADDNSTQVQTTAAVPSPNEVSR